MGCNPHCCRPTLTTGFITWQGVEPFCYTAEVVAILAETGLLHGRNEARFKSWQGEHMDFHFPTTVEGRVEEWMLGVEQEMRASSRTSIKDGMETYSSLLRATWIKTCIGMVGLVGAAAWWTYEVESAFQQVANGGADSLKVISNSSHT